MSLRLARVTLRLHRFEVLVAVAAAVLVGAWALAVTVQLDDLRLPPGCIEALAIDRGSAPQGCEPGLGRYLEIIHSQGDSVFLVVGILPFAVGLLVSVPIVGRELETGTAQIAWSLNGSRARWLRRQVWPIAVSVSLVIAFVAVATHVLAQDYLASGDPALPLLGAHGLPVVARLLAAFGLGLLTGSVVPRSIPALVVGAALCLALLVGVSQARDAWIGAHQPVPRLEDETRNWVFNGDSQWQAPDGRLLSRDDVSTLVPDELEAADVGLLEPYYSGPWLEERGYRSLPLGIPESEALEWHSYEVVLYSLAGIVGIFGAFAVVVRRRPT